MGQNAIGLLVAAEKCKVIANERAVYPPFYNLHHQCANELNHMEMICAMVYQLTKNLTPEQVKASGFDAYYIDHTTGLWPQAAGGLPQNAIEYQSKGDALTDLYEDLAAEQKARTVYDNLLRIIDDPDVREPLKFLRAREIVHFQRFGEALEMTKDSLNCKNYYFFNPEFDKQMMGNKS